MTKKPDTPKPETVKKNPLICPICGTSRDIGSAGVRIIFHCPNCEGKR